MPPRNVNCVRFRVRIPDAWKEAPGDIHAFDGYRVLESLHTQGMQIEAPLLSERSGTPRCLRSGEQVYVGALMLHAGNDLDITITGKILSVAEIRKELASVFEDVRKEER